LTTRTGDELDHTDVGEIHSRLVYGELTSTELVRRCLDRIAAVDPGLRAVVAIDETALDQAERSDRRHAAGDDLGPLDGIPVLVKDNIDTAGLSSTAGSRALAGSAPDADADVVAVLRAAGAVLLGKTNLSEWSNFRSSGATEGWSAVGGQTCNPYRQGLSPWGSSAGSAVAVAAGMAPLALGTETDGSIVGPAGVCGVVGVRPELGLVPLGGVAGISPAMDTIGPIASRVRDAATCLAVLTGQPDLASPAVPLSACRVGLWLPPGVPAEVESLLKAVAGAGIVLVEVEFEVPEEVAADGMFALYAEFRAHIEGYLRGRRAGPDSLAAVIAANRSDPVELSLFGQDLFERVAELPAAPGPAARAARDRSRQEARAVIEDVLRRDDLAAIVAPANEPAWPLDYHRGDAGRLSSSTLPALAGYPNISLPAGAVDGLPVGISVFGPRNVRRLLPLALLLERSLGPRPWPDLTWLTGS
jgi:amidase